MNGCPANKDVYPKKAIHRASRDLGSENPESDPPSTVRGLNSNRSHRCAQYSVDSVARNFVECPRCGALERQIADLADEEVEEAEADELDKCGADELLGDEVEEDGQLEEHGRAEICQGGDEEPDFDRNDDRSEGEEYVVEGDAEGTHPYYFQQRSFNSYGAQKSKNGPGRSRRQPTPKQQGGGAQNSHFGLLRRNLVSKQPDIQRQQIHNSAREPNPIHETGKVSIPRKLKVMFKRALNNGFRRIRGRDNQEALRHQERPVPL